MIEDGNKDNEGRPVGTGYRSVCIVMFLLGIAALLRDTDQNWCHCPGYDWLCLLIDHVKRSILTL